MSDTPDMLNERLKAYYNAQKLNSGSLARLKAAVEHEQKALQQRSFWNIMCSWMVQHPLTAPLTLGIIFIVGLSLFFIIGMPTAHRTAQMEAQLVAAEIALNHTKRFEAEFAPSNVRELGNVMTKLDFAPVYPERVQQAGYELTGARYCSVGGAIAVQLHLVDSAGEAYTLYQFREGSSFTVPEELAVDVNGVRVQLWNESGLIIGLAQRIPS